MIRKINKYINETIYSSQSFALLERVEEVLSGWDWDHCLNFFEMSQMLHFPSLNKACCMSGRGHFQVNTVKWKV